MLGDEGAAGISRDYALNLLEQEAPAAYLKGGGRLFLSGSQLSEDLGDALAQLDNVRMNDAAFQRAFLKVARAEGDARTRTIAGGVGAFANVGSFELDDGRSHYAVTAPDVLHPDGGAAVCLRYAGGAPAGIQYQGPFDGGAATGKIVYLGFPLESVIEPGAREGIVLGALEFFGFSRKK